MVVKNYRNLAFAAGLLCGLTSAAQFQSGQLLGDIPAYQAMSNPARVSNESVHIMLPGLSGLNVAAGHTAFALDDAIEGSTLKVNEMLGLLEDENSLWTDTRIPVFQVGVRTGRVFWRTGMATRVQSRLAYPGELLELAWKGNGHPDLIGRRLDFDGFELHASSLADYYLGAALAIPALEMTVGANVHYLAGFANVHTEHSSFGLSTDASDYTLTADGAFDIRTAGIGDLDSSMSQLDVAQLFPGSSNSGFSFDAGATAVLGEYFVEASASNIGWMNWRDQTQRYTLDESTISFSGFDLAELEGSQDSIEQILTQFTDSLTNTFDVRESNGDYRVATNGAFQLTGSREFWQGGRVYLGLSHTRRFGIGMGGVHTGVVQQVKSILRVQAGMQLFNRNQFLVSGGMSVRLGPCFIFAQVENVPGLISPLKHRTWQGSAGIALRFGKPDKAAVEAVAN